jgi:hypothetical protein
MLCASACETTVVSMRTNFERSVDERPDSNALSTRSLALRALRSALRPPAAMRTAFAR